MAKIITTYIAVLLLVSLGFFGVGAIASANGVARSHAASAVCIAEDPGSRTGRQPQTGEAGCGKT
jgi:hypothetical protein